MKQLRRALKEAGDDLSDLKDLHKRVATIAASAAKPLTPASDRSTGRLKASIRAAGTKTAAVIRAGSKRVPYANAIHWGRRVWPSVQSAPHPPRKRVNAFIRPSLFLTDGAKSTEPTWVAIYEEEVKKQVEKIGDST